jgi:hypothetical protein
MDADGEGCPTENTPDSAKLSGVRAKKMPGLKPGLVQQGGMKMMSDYASSASIAEIGCTVCTIKEKASQLEAMPLCSKCIA